MVDAWRRRHGGGSPKPILVLVGGYAGSGKTEFSRFLSDITGWAFLDIEFRAAARDTWKLSNWDQYATGLRVETSPPTTHVTVDNRLGAAISLADQTREALKRRPGACSSPAATTAPPTAPS
ncbi:hypothetical protein [Microtetraspora malaysiensis]|uniref:hypothetical protein n=1 Tax=Microtetraspora malaysiensis TaxID=161358 RepID=UPI00082D0225|nr:hypothetical protein [Microtetraspora malaysiensis]